MPLNAVEKNTLLGATSVTHIGVHTLIDPGTGTDANSGEATGGSPAYARVAVTWAAASGGTRANSGALTINVDAGTYGYLTYWNASSGNTNNYRGYAPMGGANALKGFFSLTDTTADTFESAAHGMANNDRVLLFDVFAESLPTGVSEGTIYWVVNATTDGFQVSTTQGGGAVAITGAGEGFWQRIVPEVFAAQGQITVAVGALVLDANAM